jgi:hypothetical protein
MTTCRYSAEKCPAASASVSVVAPPPAWSSSQRSRPDSGMAGSTGDPAQRPNSYGSRLAQ